jgi:hypothetical protein
VRIPIEALIEAERRKEETRNSFVRPFLEAPRPMPMYRDDKPAPSRGETAIDIGGEEDEESDRGVVIISIWDD